MRGKRGNPVILVKNQKATIIISMSYDKLYKNLKNIYKDIKYDKINIPSLEQKILENAGIIKEAANYRLAVLEKPIQIGYSYSRYKSFGAGKYIYKAGTVRPVYVLEPDGSIRTEEKIESVWCSPSGNEDEKIYNIEIIDPCTGADHPIDYLSCLKKHGYSLHRPPIRLKLKPEVAEEVQQLGCTNIKHEIENPKYDYLHLVPEVAYNHMHRKLKINADGLEVIKHLAKLKLYFEINCTDLECDIITITAYYNGKKATVTVSYSIVLDYDGDKELAKFIIDTINMNADADVPETITLDELLRDLLQIALEDKERVLNNEPPKLIPAKTITKIEKSCVPWPYQYRREEEGCIKYKTEKLAPGEKERLLEQLNIIIHSIKSLLDYNRKTN